MLEKEFLDYVKQQDITCGPGWYGLVLWILEVLKYHNENNPEIQYKIIRIEEKMGELHIEIPEKFPGFVKKMINMANVSSKTICEYCGCIGELQQYDGGYKTLCSECKKKYKRKKEPIVANVANDVLDYMSKQSTIHCEYGWYGLIMSVVVAAVEYNVKNPDNPYKPLFEEKDGKLSIEPDAPPESLKEIIHRAQDASGKICDRCGCRGKLQEGMKEGPRTLCRECGKMKYDEIKTMAIRRHRLKAAERGYIIWNNGDN